VPHKLPSFITRPSEYTQPFPDEISKGSVRPVVLCGREFGPIKIRVTRPRVENELDSRVIGPCPFNVLGSVDNTPNEKPKE
jgi:hypothetical protein